WCFTANLEINHSNAHQIMKNTVIGVLLFGLLIHLSACTSNPSDLDKDNAKGAYEQARAVGDFQAASMWCYQLIYLEPDERPWKDSLLNLLFIRRVWPVCETLGEDLLSLNEADTRVLGILGNAEKAQGKSAEAIAHFETLVQHSDLPIYRYELASLQYELERRKECKKNLELLLTNPATTNGKIELRYGTKRQTVSLKAAGLNLLGIVEKDYGQPDLAKGLFEQALAIEPDFDLAKGNLDAL
ncbi:MAG: hypothetical protein AAFV80_23745, partial [Bacteroidota bacterium]